MNAAVTTRPAAETSVSFSIRPDSSEIRRASAWLDAAGNELGIPGDELWRLDLCLNEALANVITHGMPIASAPIRLCLVVQREDGGGSARLTISDAAAAFNPLAVVPRPKPLTVAEAEPGGHGLNLMRRFARSLDYEHRDGHNHLTMHFRWHGDA